MNKEFSNFIKDYVDLLKEKSAQSHAKAQACDNEADTAFSQGANFAYYDALESLKSQLESFGYEEDFEVSMSEQLSLSNLQAG